MTLTFHPDPEQEKLINKLKEMYFEKTATAAVSKAIKYAVNERDNDKTKIAELNNKIDEDIEREKYVKSLIQKILTSIPILFKYSEGQKI